MKRIIQTSVRVFGMICLGACDPGTAPTPDEESPLQTATLTPGDPASPTPEASPSEAPSPAASSTPVPDDGTPTPTEEPGPSPTGAPASPTPDSPPTANPTSNPDPEGSPSPDGDPEMLVVAGGEVSGVWCSQVQVLGDVVVPSGKELSMCPGTEVSFGSDAGLQVNGSLTLEGSEEERVVLAPSEVSWPGITVVGQVTADHVLLTGASVGINGLEGSSLFLLDTEVIDCAYSLLINQGADIRNSTIIGGKTIQVTGGVLSMTDTTVDLLKPVSGPDCVSLSGGGALLDHVYLTGCHCTLHINRAPEGVSLTNSILDGCSYPVMIADTTATFNFNNLSGASADFLDIGGGISADVSRNYYDGGAPEISTANASQFSGSNVYATTPYEDAGPR